MKTMVKIILMILSVLLAIPSSYAGDIPMEEPVSSEMILNYDEILEQSMGAGKKSSTPDLTGYSDIDSERYPFLKGKNNTNTGVGSGYNVSHYERVDIYNFRPSLANNITYNFSREKSMKSSASSFFGVPSRVSDVFLMGAAFMTNLAVHEVGHEVVAQHEGAIGSRLNFFHKQGGDFFLGTSSVEKIDKKSVLPYTMGGEFFADLTFEHALHDYRKKPNMYNKSLLLVSGTDFLWYCFYAFYLADDNPAYDPITISEETGLSRDMLFSVALAKTLLNAYRVYSGQDRIVPYFKVDRYSASLNIMIPFEFGS